MFYFLDSEDENPSPKFSWKNKSKFSTLIITRNFLMQQPAPCLVSYSIVIVDHHKTCKVNTTRSFAHDYIGNCSGIGISVFWCVSLVA